VNRFLIFNLGFVVSIFFSFSLAIAEMSSIEKAQVKVVMHTFEAEMAKLRPYLVSDEAFQDPKALEKIDRALKSLEKQLNVKKPKGIEDNPGFRVTFDLMAHHIRQARRSFDRRQLSNARQRLAATGNFCMTCHTQTPESANAFIGPFGEDPKLKSPTLVNAEFLFITRRFDQALDRMNELIRKYPKSSLRADQLMDVYRRKLAIFARVQRNPKAAIENFKTDLANKEIPMDVRRNVEGWIKYLEAWQIEKEDPAQLNTAKLMEFVKRRIPEEQLRKIAPADPDIVANLRLSGLLYERLLNEPESPFAQEILYYLAGIERQLSPLYWYSLSDSYLRECVRRFPKRPLTKTCYDTLESHLRARYLGDGKTDEDVQNQLSELKQYL